MTTDKIVVKTPLGTITAQAAADTEHPGISFDLVRPGSEEMMSLGLVEFTSDGTEGGGQIITRDGVMEGKRITQSVSFTKASRISLSLKKKFRQENPKSTLFCAIQLRLLG